MEETIQRTIINNHRYYQVCHDSEIIGTFPSVTTILGETADHSWLESWKNRIGADAADKIGREATERGTVMHRLCELYLSLPNSLKPQVRLAETLELSKLDVEINQYDTRAKIVGGTLFYNYVRSGIFDRISKVLAQEKFMWTVRDGGYAGTLDNLSELNNGEIAIIDFKTSKKPKTQDQIYDYKLQVSAYAISVWDRLNIKVNECQIWISNEADSSPQVFILRPTEIKFYYYKFIERLGVFYSMN